MCLCALNFLKLAGTWACSRVCRYLWIAGTSVISYTFTWVEFPAKLSEAVEGFFQVCYELILGLGFDDDVINISFNIAM